LENFLLQEHIEDIKRKNNGFTKKTKSRKDQGAKKESIFCNSEKFSGFTSKNEIGCGFNYKEASERLEKLLKSAIANWENKNEGEKPEKHNLFVKEIRVDYAGMLKRYRPAPQGRAHRIRKRSNHVTLYIDSKAN
jgi:ribosomal protein L22